MPLTDYHDMVQTFASNRANHALGIGILPRRSWRYDRLLDAQCLGLTRKSLSIDLVSVPNQIPRRLVPPTYSSDPLTPPGADTHDGAHQRAEPPPPGRGSAAVHPDVRVRLY